MALSNKSVSLLIFFVVFSAVFPVAGFALTFSAGTPDISGVSEEALMQAGIILTDVATENVTDDEAWVYFALNDSDYRVRWMDPGTPNERYFEWQVPHGILGWSWPTTIDPSPYGVLLVISNWDNDYNWTRATLDSGGASEAECFFTIYPGYDNITQCMDEGNVTMTIGRSYEPAAADLWTFTSWFFGMVTGIETYNMPAFFVWLIRVITLIGLLSFVLLAREFIPTLP